jgi:hypothetical protein
MRLLLGCIALFVALPYLVNQVRKPTKWIGRFFLWLMNVSHSSVTDWGLKHVTIEKLAALANEGMIYGVDYTKGSVAASRSKNARLIEAAVMK